MNLVHSSWTAAPDGAPWTKDSAMAGSSPELGLMAARRHGSSSAMAQQIEGSMGNPSQASLGLGR
jgi:hypothetical protein